MSGRYEERLTELREEFEKGQQALAEIDARRERLKESMLRIAGAVQVLEEMAGVEGDLESGAQENPPGAPGLEEEDLEVA